MRGARLRVRKAGQNMGRWEKLHRHVCCRQALVSSRSMHATTQYCSRNISDACVTQCSPLMMAVIIQPQALKIHCASPVAQLQCSSKTSKKTYKLPTAPCGIYCARFRVQMA